MFHSTEDGLPCTKVQSPISLYNLSRRSSSRAARWRAAHEGWSDYCVANPERLGPWCQQQPPGRIFQREQPRASQTHGPPLPSAIIAPQLTAPKVFIKTESYATTNRHRTLPFCAHAIKSTVVHPRHESNDRVMSIEKSARDVRVRQPGVPPGDRPHIRLVTFQGSAEPQTRPPPSDTPAHQRHVVPIKHSAQIPSNAPLSFSKEKNDKPAY